MKKISFILLFALAWQLLSAQEEKPKNWVLTGYIKNLQTLIIQEVKIPVLNLDTTIV